jgi:putative inorganic carbon (HCO3(-)) transporter
MILFYFIVLFSAVPEHPWFGYQTNGLNLVKLVGILCFLYAIFHSILSRRVPFFFATWPARLFAALFFLACVSYATEGSAQSAASRVTLTVYFEYFILFLITIAIVDSFKRLRYSLLAFIGAMGLGSLYTFREFQNSGFAPEYRPGYVVLDGNFFSAAALLAIPLAYYLMKATIPRRERVFCLACLVVTVLAVIVIASRGAFLGLCTCVLYMFIRTKHRASVVAFVLVLVPLLIYSPSSPIQRIATPGYGDQQSTRAHLMVWKAALTIVAKHPISGIGLANFWATIQQQNLFGSGTGLMAHNTYLEYAAELGVFGLLLYLGILISTDRLLEKVHKKASFAGDAFSYAAARGIQAGIPGFAVAAFFFSAEYEKPLWIILSLSVCMPNLIRSKRMTGQNTKELESVSLSATGSLEPAEKGIAFGAQAMNGQRIST